MKKHLRRAYRAMTIFTVLFALLTVFLISVVRMSDTRKSMHSTLHAASAWTEDSDKDLYDLSKSIASAASPLRVTFIMREGLVLVDTAASSMRMENHADREEIIEALQGGIGEDFRYSETEKDITFYAAMQISDRLILRLSYPLREIFGFSAFYILGAVAAVLAMYLIQRSMITRFANHAVSQLDTVKELLEGKKVDIDRVAFPEYRAPMHMIAYQIERLQSDYEEVQRSLNVRKNFVSHASHELKSPLTSIQGFAEMLYEGMADTPEEQEMFLSCVLNECARMRTLIDDLLMLSRAERQDSAEKTDVDVRKTAAEIVNALTARAQQRGITLNLTGDLTIQAAEKDIWEILYNLIDNAVRYSHENGSVEIRLMDGGFEVEDHGVGIESKHLPLLFEPFYRVEQGQDKSGGTGLGLSIVRSLVERNGAKITVDSQIGIGSTFKVHFL